MSADIRRFAEDLIVRLAGEADVIRHKAMERGIPEMHFRHLIGEVHGLDRAVEEISEAAKKELT